MNYVGIWNDRLYVFNSLSMIPEELKAGLDLQPYEIHGENILGDEDNQYAVG